MDNYPGFPEGVEGPELMQKMREQAEAQGAVVLDDEVDELIPGARSRRIPSRR